jgi:hypothetical protein
MSVLSHPFFFFLIFKITSLLSQLISKSNHHLHKSGHPTRWHRPTFISSVNFPLLILFLLNLHYINYANLTLYFNPFMSWVNLLKFFCSICTWHVYLSVLQLCLDSSIVLMYDLYAKVCLGFGRN